MEDNFITLKIDDKEVKAKEGTTILQAAKQCIDKCPFKAINN